MRYLGSKTLLVQQILDLIGRYEPGDILCDPFGGVGTVGSFMKKHSFRVVSGDVLHFAHYYQKTLIELEEEPDFTFLLGNNNIGIESYLNNVIAEDGWLIREYSQNRGFFTIENAKHIQGCIDTIWGWRNKIQITEDEYALLIASLIQSMDKVANTAGTYYAYLKEFYRKALQPFRFKLLHPNVGKYHCQCYLKDANQLVRDQKCKVLYLDPPYNEREYSQYYHLPETIALGLTPIPKGKSGIPNRTFIRSPYTIKTEAKNALTDLVHNCNAEMIIFHYADSGLIDEYSAKKLMNEMGRVKEYYFDCKGYRTTRSNENKKSKHHIYKVVL